MWNIFSIVFYLMLLISVATIGIGYLVGCYKMSKLEEGMANVAENVGRIIDNENVLGRIITEYKNCKADSPDEHGPNSPVAIGFSFFGIGITLGFIKLMYFCQMHPTIGPIVISIKKIINDIFLVAVVFLIFLFSFGLGIYSVMRVTDDSVCDKTHSFHKLNDSFRSLFWNFFDPGKIEQLGCSEISQKTPRYLGMILFGAFLLFNVIILLNALIAIMNSTLQEVNMDKVSRWKFERTTMWLKHFDSNYVLPCPFNLLEYITFFIIYIFNCCFCRKKEKERKWMDDWDTDR